MLSANLSKPPDVLVFAATNLCLFAAALPPSLVTNSSALFFVGLVIVLFMPSISFPAVLNIVTASIFSAGARESWISPSCERMGAFL